MQIEEQIHTLSAADAWHFLQLKDYIPSGSLINLSGKVTAISETFRVKKDLLFLIEVETFVKILVKQKSYLVWQGQITPNDEYIFTSLRPTTLQKGTASPTRLFVPWTKSTVRLASDVPLENLYLKEWLQQHKLDVAPTLLSSLSPPPLHHEATKFVSYQGFITDCSRSSFGIYELDHRIGLYVSSVPAAHSFSFLRSGVKIVLYNAHRRGFSTAPKIRLFCCVSTSIRVVESDVGKQESSQTSMTSPLLQPISALSLTAIETAQLLDLPSQMGKLLNIGQGHISSNSFIRLVTFLLSGTCCPWLQDTPRCLLQEFLEVPHNCCVGKVKQKSRMPTLTRVENERKALMEKCGDLTDLQEKYYGSLLSVADLNKLLYWTPLADHVDCSSHTMLVGYLRCNPVTGRLQLEDASGSVDIAVCSSSQPGDHLCSSECNSPKPGCTLTCTAVQPNLIGSLICVKKYKRIAERFLITDLPNSYHIDTKYISRSRYVIYLMFSLTDCVLLHSSEHISNAQTSRNVDTSKRRIDDVNPINRKVVSRLIYISLKESMMTVSRNVAPKLRFSVLGHFIKDKSSECQDESGLTLIKRRCTQGKEHFDQTNNCANVQSCHQEMSSAKSTCTKSSSKSATCSQKQLCSNQDFTSESIGTSQIVRSCNQTSSQCSVHRRSKSNDSLTNEMMNSTEKENQEKTQMSVKSRHEELKSTQPCYGKINETCKQVSSNGECSQARKYIDRELSSSSNHSHMELPSSQCSLAFTHEQTSSNSKCDSVMSTKTQNTSKELSSTKFSKGNRSNCHAKRCTPNILPSSVIPSHKEVPSTQYSQVKRPQAGESPAACPEPVVLLFQDCVRWYPLLHPGAVYRLTVEGEGDLLTPKIQGEKLKKAAKFSYTRLCVEVPPSATVARIFKDGEHFLQEVDTPVHNKYSAIEDILSDSYPDNQVSLYGRIVSRSHKSPDNPSVGRNRSSRPSQHIQLANHTLGVSLLDNHNVCLQVQSLTSPREVTVYMNLQNMSYPFGLVPGTGVVFHRLERKVSCIDKVYCQFTAVSTVSVFHINNTDNQGQDKTSDDKTKGEAPAPAQHIVQLWQAREAVQLFRTSVYVCHFLKLCLKSVCSSCSSVVTSSGCSSPSCSNTDTHFTARVHVLVDDGTSPAVVMVTNETLLQKLLRLSTEQWRHLESATQEQGEVFMSQFVGEGESVLENFLMRLCNSRHVKRQCQMTLQHRETHDGTRNTWKTGFADINKMAKDEFAYHSVKAGAMFQTRCLPYLLLECVALEEDLS